MTISAIQLPAEPIDREPFKAKAAPDRAEMSGSFLDNLKRVSDVEEVSTNVTSGTSEIPQSIEIPVISEQITTDTLASLVIFQPESVDQTSSKNEAPTPLPDIQNLVVQVAGSVATPESVIETSASDKVENVENSEDTFSKHDDEDVLSDTDKDAGNTAITVPEILLAALPVAVPIQNTPTPSENEQERDAPERKEPAQTSPATLTTFKAFVPITGNTRTDEEALQGSEADTADSENDNTQAPETETFSEVLAKSSDLGAVKQAAEEIRKAIGLPNDSGQMPTTFTRPTPINDLPLEIGMRVLEGAREIQIVLSPESLGEISIKLDIASDSSISAQFTTDNPATLALLMQDASTLKKSLDQTGLSTNSASLQFSLSREGQQNNNPNDRNSQGRHQQTAYGEPTITNQGKDLSIPPIQAYSLQRLDRII